ncbi:FERM and PDZ domain-containing protein 2 [Arapaima gigas]
MSTFVTLAEVLEARGAPLEEDEVWSLLLGTTESLLDTSCKGTVTICSLISPGSLLLSDSGSLAFRSCAWSEEMCSFTAPEVLQGRAITTRLAVEKVLIYSLGMTLYWSVDYHLPQNQPVQLSRHLNSLLLSMCEDMAYQRADLLSIHETCKRHHKAALLLPPSTVIKQLVQDVLHDAVDNILLLQSPSHLNHRSQAIRDRLHGRRTPGCSDTNSGSQESSGLSTDTEIKQGHSHLQSMWAHNSKGTLPTICQTSPGRCPFKSQLMMSAFFCHFLQNLEPEFIRMLGEPQIILELPGSIVKGKACATQTDLNIVMPSGLSILVKCDIKSRVGDVFDVVVAHAGLVEHFYFGLAFMDNKEFFFLDNEAKISKVDCWKKAPSTTLVLFLRVKFFIDDITFLLHKLTQHQYYLQLRKDLLEDRLHCSEEIALLLSALALQAEFGNYASEVCEKTYYKPEQYISKSLVEKMPLLCLKGELARLHASWSKIPPEEAELEFLKVAQQLPDYGVLFHQVTQEKRPAMGKLMLGICAKGIMLYEVKNCRSAILRFLWEETSSISSCQRKFTIKSTNGRKTHTFFTDSTKTSKYLLCLCSAQHKFHKEMISRHQSHRFVFEENIVQFATECRARCNHFQQPSCSEIILHGTQANSSPSESTSKSCKELHALPIDQSDHHKQIQKDDQCDTVEQEPWSSPDLSPRGISTATLQNHDPELISLPSTSRENLSIIVAEREVICVHLKKDPKLGLGIVIVGEDNIGELDLGIFITSVVPDGPVDKDGRIQPGSRLISLNKTSLEGVPFSMVADILQSSPEEVELIVSQPKRRCAWPQSMLRSLLERKFVSQAAILGEYQPSVKEMDEILSMMTTQKPRSRLQVPMGQILNAQGHCSRSSSVVSFKPEEILFVKLRKINDSLGIIVAAGQRDGIFISSIIPGGAAEQDGRVQTGDRLVKVDGVRLQGVTQQQAIKALMATGEVVNLVLARECPTWIQTANPKLLIQNQGSVNLVMPFSLTKDYSFVSDDNTLEVTLRKNHSGLGFSFMISELDSTEGGGTIVWVKKLFPGQPAERCRLIREGDIILAVNGERLKGLPYQRVLDLIRSSPAKVRLSICRPSRNASIGPAALESPPCTVEIRSK